MRSRCVQRGENSALSRAPAVVIIADSAADAEVPPADTALLPGVSTFVNLRHPDPHEQSSRLGSFRLRFSSTRRMQGADIHTPSLASP
jgi:hypothetical protein